jgi:hypothetical protein
VSRYNRCAQYDLLLFVERPECLAADVKRNVVGL